MILDAGINSCFSNRSSRPVSSGGFDDRSQPGGHHPGYRDKYRPSSNPSASCGHDPYDISELQPGGNYVVSVTTHRNGASEKATGCAIANVQGFHTDLTVNLDIRSLPPGTYFLANTHEGDPASYFYPLSVR